MAPCGSCKNRRFGGTYRLHRSEKSRRARNSVFTLMMKAIRSSETSVLTRATRRHIPDDGILHTRFCFISRHTGVQDGCCLVRTNSLPSVSRLSRRWREPPSLTTLCASTVYYCDSVALPGLASLPFELYETICLYFEV
jgi:hypothetical protein